MNRFFDILKMTRYYTGYSDPETYIEKEQTPWTKAPRCSRQQGGENDGTSWWFEIY